MSGKKEEGKKRKKKNPRNLYRWWEMMNLEFVIEIKVGGRKERLFLLENWANYSIILINKHKRGKPF